MQNNTSNDGGPVEALEDLEQIESANDYGQHVIGGEKTLGATGDTAWDKKADAERSMPSIGSAAEMAVPVRKVYAGASVEPDRQI